MSLYWPLPVEVDAAEDGAPVAVDGVAVEAIREEWLVSDRWWTPRPLERRYFELALADGRDMVVFSEGAEGDRSSGKAGRGHWFQQRA